MNTITTLHIPIEQSVRRKLTAKAKRLGFDSLQAYIRVWAKAESDNRTVDFHDDWGEPTPKAAARLNRWADEAIRLSKAGKLPSANSVDELMKQLNG